MPVRTILVAVDGSNLSSKALAFSIERALLHKAELIAAFAVNRLSVAIATAAPYAYVDAKPLLDALDAEADAVLDGAEALARTSGVRVRRVKLDGVAAPQILQAARDFNADLIVMGTHGRRGFDRLAVGSTAEDTIRGADVPVFALPAQCDRASKNRALSHALVAVDGSPASRAAINFAVELARTEGCKTTLCTVIEKPGFHWGDLDRSAVLEEELERRGRAEIDAECAYASAGGIAADCIVLAGEATSEILRAAAKAGADCIIIGTHGRAGIPRFVIGSVAEGVLRHSQLPVCTVRSS